MNIYRNKTKKRKWGKNFDFLSLRFLYEKARGEMALKKIFLYT